VVIKLRLLQMECRGTLRNTRERRF